MRTDALGVYYFGANGYSRHIHPPTPVCRNVSMSYAAMYYTGIPTHPHDTHNLRLHNI